MSEPSLARVLVVDDEVVLAQAIARALRRLDFHVETAHDGDVAFKMLGTSFFDVLLIDVHLPNVDGLALLDRAQAMPDPPLCFMVTGRADLRSAIDAMRRGAADYLEKPIDIADLTVRLERALKQAAMKRKLLVYEEREKNTNNPIVVSPAMKMAFALADKVAASPNSSALILGESGVGKEVIAARIHHKSARRDAPFVKVNLAAIPESMVEAELFGSVRGAFTDAKRDRAGHFASADGGTLLLDELCEFKTESQSKLLRVLEERKFYPVGSDRIRSVNVRVIAATNRDPHKAIREGLLRADLFYRLGTVTIHLPPLRDRRDEILPLADRFLHVYAGEFGRPPCTVSEAARQRMLEYSWPGNVRELRNVIERAVMLADGPTITPAVLGIAEPDPYTSDYDSGRYEPRSPREEVRDRQSSRESLTRRDSRTELEAYREDRPPSSGDLPPTSFKLDDARQAALEQVEREHILRVLKIVGGSRTRAADMLGVSRSTLWEKVKRYGIE